MRRASVILGFTEAELGLALAVLFVAIAGSQVLRADRAEEKLAAAEERLDSLGMVLDSLRERTSRLDPYCHERGEPDVVIATVTVLGRGDFSISGRRMDYDGVIEELNDWVSVARRKRCRFTIEVLSGEGLTPDQYLSARAPLAWRYFYFTR